MIRKLVVVVAVVTVCWLASDAEAQRRVPAGRFFASLDGGFQTGSEDLVDSVTDVLYGEEYTTDTTYMIDRSGGLFRANMGLLLWRNFGFAVGFTRSTSSGTADVTAAVPNPLFFDRPREIATSVSAAGHRENMLHFQGVLALVLSDRVEVTLFGGPSRVSLDQAIVNRAVIDLNAEVSPFSDIEFADVVVTEARETGLAFNVGVDLSYMWTPSFGLGGFVQYTGGSVDMPLAGGLTPVTVGGLQVGGGFRIRLIPN